MSVRIPAPADLLPLLSALIGRDLKHTINSEPLEPSAVENKLTLFVDDVDDPLMLAGGDDAFAFLSGAALAMLPKVRAEEAIASGVDSDDLMDCYFEVMNVLTRVINDQGGDHVRLIPQSSVVLSDLPDPVKGTGLDIEIDGYGTGRISFWLF